MPRRRSLAVNAAQIALASAGVAFSCGLCYLLQPDHAGGLHSHRGWRCGRSSVVERQLPKLYVVGSIPIARSKFSSNGNLFVDLPLVARRGRVLAAV